MINYDDEPSHSNDGKHMARARRNCTKEPNASIGPRSGSELHTPLALELSCRLEDGLKKTKKGSESHGVG
jgi:hypothetical protein